ncbi:hypothetical protein Pmar_PMAR015579 [Perkinsus marinus ATCC 50983]|uniref:RRM domain-containing protein n=1 Tax=Perkinsus marinus (strain ATCC 50983 / TXsc) TaxID=423536 RepID=C5KUI5_PERM5|nr:hypothetical protein Pmar_PMAR015579 [Perkinsus marinus ATCC 50983]EER11872.1 hypothetical protein Pmar_PMAR015579 [Perkinsus marinus ATCC 50983]|eukprot:XP_002780077.1 hypothetical protein Pmar_PMAR015579 [Perkinsus marinus ATCC 50983]
MSQPGTPVPYYQTLYHHPGTPQMTPQSPASSVRSVGSFAPIGYPQAYAAPIQSPVYTGVGAPYASPLSQSVPQQQGSMGEYAPPVYQLPYGAIPPQQQQAYRYPSPSPVAAAAAYYGGAYHPGMIRSGGGGSPTNSIRSLSSDGRGMPQSPMNMGAPMVLQRDPSGNMILPPVGYFVRDAENVDPDNLCYADIRHNKPEPSGTGDSLGSAASTYRSPPERRFQSGYANAEHQQRGEGPSRHHHHRKHVHQTTIQQEQQGHEESGNTLRTLLQELDEEDENCIFIVRRIHKFGFKSPVFLREYFEEYGQVCKVLVAHSRQLQSGPHDTTRTRSRPASLGFVLMGDSESVQRILADGPTHKIADVEITVHHFENRHPEKDSQAESSQDQQHSQ